MTDIARKAIGAESVIETKAIEGFEIKDADLGEVVAVVSTMNVVDRDGDVVLSGAIKDGAVVKLSAYEHDVITEGKAPVGRGVVSIEGDRAVLKARYFMSTTRGRDAFNTVKEMGGDSEWSIGFSKQVKTAPMTDEWKAKGARRLIAGLNLYESSPVFMGANGMTGTVAVKEVSTLDAADQQVDEQADGGGSPPTLEDVDLRLKAAEAVTAQLREERDLRLKAALDSAARERDENANRVAKEIYERFQRNMGRGK